MVVTAQYMFAGVSEQAHEQRHTPRTREEEWMENFRTPTPHLDLANERHRATTNRISEKLGVASEMVRSGLFFSKPFATLDLHTGGTQVESRVAQLATALTQKDEADANLAHEREWSSMPQTRLKDKDDEARDDEGSPPHTEDSVGTVDVARINQMGPVVPWISTKGTWKFQGGAGKYHYDPKTMKLTTNYGTSTVAVTYSDVNGNGFKQYSSDLEILGIKMHVGSIMRDIQAEVTRHRVFVLPSQLNAAEYYANNLSESKLRAYGLNEYLEDGTGGPRGQLACDLGVAQFIIDNASNELRPDRGIDNVRGMGSIPGVRLNNGYLKVASNADVQAFSDALPRMTVLGVRDVAVRGLKAFGDPNGPHTFVKRENHSVDLIYASACPVGAYGNDESAAVKEISKMVLYGQYAAALRQAITRKSCDVFLMPLGGGVFKNDPSNIKSAIASAVQTLSVALADSDVSVHVLAWEQNPEEESLYRSHRS
jgi:hypothetical protein